MKTIKTILLFTSAFLLWSHNEAQAQNIGINGTGALAHQSALLDVDAAGGANRGLLVPRIAITGITDGTTVTSPATSLLIYNTATANSGTLAVSPGYYYWDGTKWVRFAYSASGSSSTAWDLLGNAGTNPTTNFLGTTDAQDLAFRTNNLEAVRVTTAGNVGIGTTTPLNKLTIGVNNGSTYVISANSSTPYGLNLITSEAISSNNAALWIRTTSDGGSTFKQLFRVQNDGNVAIGTLTPNVSGSNANANVLTVSGKTSGAGQASNGRIELANSIPSASLTPNQTIAGQLLGCVNNNGAGFGSADPVIGTMRFTLDGVGGASGYGGKITFATKFDNGIITDRMYLLHNGNLGIGAATPVTKLEVAPSSLYTGINTGDGIMINNTSLTAANLFLGINGLNSNAIQSRNGTATGYGLALNPFGGNVGIGTTVPNNKLEITHGTVGNSGLRFTNLPNAAVLKTDANGDVVPATAITATNNGVFWALNGNSGTTAGTNFLGTTDAQDLVLTSNNLQAVRINTAGNVAIGNPSFSHKLNVFSTGTNDGIYLYSNGNGGEISGHDDTHFNVTNGRTILPTISMPSYGIAMPPTPTAAEMWISGNNGVSLFSNGLERVRLDGSGRLGIGTTTPLVFLQVEGASNNLMNLVNTSSSINVPAWNNYIQFGDGTLNAGYVGEGSSSGKLMSLVGHYGHGVTLASFQGNTAGTLNAKIDILPGGNSSIVFNTKNTNHMILDSVGRVGIGNMLPQSKLDVNGIILSGDATSTNGSIMLAGQYGGLGSMTSLLGTEYSSGAPCLSYCVRTSTTTGASFINTHSLTPVNRAALVLGGVGGGSNSVFRFYGGLYQTLANGVTPIMTEFMTMKDNGNLGIGDVTPSSRLSVAGNGLFGGQPIAGLNNALIHVSSGNLANEAYNRFGYWNGTINTGIYDVGLKAGGSTFMIRNVDSGTEDANRSLYMLNTGNVGIGTNAPSERLHIKNALMQIDGSTNAISNVAGVRIGLNNGTSLGYVGDGSTTDNDMLLYSYNDNVRLGTGPAATAANSLYLTQAGNVGIGTAAPSYKLDVVGGTVAGAGAYVNTSDRRKKQNIQKLNINAIDVVNKLNPVTYEWKEQGDIGMKGTQMGFIAQELEEVLPSMVITKDDADKTKAIKSTDLLPVYAKAIQELSQKMEAFKKENEDLKKRIEFLEKK